MDNEPIFKINKLNIAGKDQSAFVKEQEAELENSIPAEDGTLMLSSGHDPEQEDTNYIIELYRNSETYEAHSMADYVDHYDQVVKQLASKQKTYDLQAEWITTKSKEELNHNSEKFVLRVGKVELADGQAAKFATSVKKEMRRSIAQEAGVKILMAGANKQNKNEWLFFSAFANDAAYDQHLKTKWYTQYAKETEKLIKDKQIRPVVRDTLAIQGPIVLD